MEESACLLLLLLLLLITPAVGLKARDITMSMRDRYLMLFLVLVDYMMICSHSYPLAHKLG